MQARKAPLVHLCACWAPPTTSLMACLRCLAGGRRGIIAQRQRQTAPRPLNFRKSSTPAPRRFCATANAETAIVATRPRGQMTPTRRNAESPQNSPHVRASRTCWFSDAQAPGIGVNGRDARSKSPTERIRPSKANTQLSGLDVKAGARPRAQPPSRGLCPNKDPRQQHFPPTTNCRWVLQAQSMPSLPTISPSPGRLANQATITENTAHKHESEAAPSTPGRNRPLQGGLDSCCCRKSLSCCRSMRTRPQRSVVCNATHDLMAAHKGVRGCHRAAHLICDGAEEI